MIYFGLEVPSVWVLWGLSVRYMGSRTPGFDDKAENLKCRLLMCNHISLVRHGRAPQKQPEDTWDFYPASQQASSTTHCLRSHSVNILVPVGP